VSNNWGAVQLLFSQRGVFLSKRTRTSKVEKWIKEGRGSGIGADYKPWLNIQDVSSLGRSTRLKGIKTKGSTNFYQIWNETTFFN